MCRKPCWALDEFLTPEFSFLLQQLSDRVKVILQIEILRNMFLTMARRQGCRDA